MKLDIRKSTFDDLDRMLEIYERARVFMAETGNPRQWGATNWPPINLLKEDIEVGRSFVCTSDGKVEGTFVYMQGVDIEPTYRKMAEGEWMDDSEYGVVHRLAGSGDVKGIGKRCMEWAFEQCGHVRVDTHYDNKVMQRMFEKLGYTKVGVIHVVEDNDPRYAYEKVR